MNKPQPKRPRGRPPKAADARRSERVQAYVTPGVYAALEARARERGVSVDSLAGEILERSARASNGDR